MEVRYITRLALGVLLYTGTLCAQTKVSLSSGLWGSPLTWSPVGVPAPTDNVLIQNGHTIDLNLSATCNNLELGTTGAANLRFASPLSVSLTVNGNITINSLSGLTIKPASNTFHALMLYGNVLNNGTLDLRKNVISLCNTYFLGSSNQQITGTGTTDFNNITVNKGTSASSTVEISAGPFFAPNNFLTVVNGTFRLSTPNVTAVPFSSAGSVGSSASVCFNSPNSVFTTSAGLSVAGRFELAAGTLNVGDAANEDLSSTGGTIVISGGTLNIAGKLAGGAGMNFNMSSGCLVAAALGSTNTLIAPVEIPATASFSMSGGSIVIARPGGTGSQHLGYRNYALGTVTGGTLQAGSPAYTLTPSTISILSAGSIPSLLVANSAVTCQLSAPAQVLGNVTVSSGTLSANGQALTLGGNWSNSGTFLPFTSTVSFQSASAQSIFRSGGENFYHLSLGGTGIKTFSAPVTTGGNFIVETGASVSLGTGNHSLAVGGNFVNNGSFAAGTGLVQLSGTLAQNVGGSSPTSFHDLTINNSAGAALSQSVSLKGTLSLLNGNLNTSSGALTLLSDNTATGRIGPISGTGDITGNVTVQRFIPGGFTGWSLLGSPISSQLSFSEWDDDLFISCATCPDGYVPNFPSIYSYNEAAPGAYDDTSGYAPITSISDPLQQGKGYWVYSGTSQYSTANQQLDMTGPVRKFNYSMPLSYSNLSSAANDGWNLIHNPYPSPISWTMLRGTNTAVDNAIYTYNADLNAGTGGFASYVNNVSSPAVASGGIGDAIPMCQGFYVHCTSATSLQVTETVKTAVDQSLLKVTAPAPVKPLLRIVLKGPYKFRDETVLYFEPGTTVAFDRHADAIKMRGQNPYVPSIALQHGNDPFQVNGLPPLTGSLSLLLRTLTGYPGTYTISLVAEGMPLEAGTCLSLKDRFTNNTTDLRKAEYKFFLSDTTKVPRFELSLISNSISVQTSGGELTCVSPQQGKIKAQPAGQGSWNYTWLLNNVLIRNHVAAAADSISIGSAGHYRVLINTIGLCDNYSGDVFVTPAVQPVAGFDTGNSIYHTTSQGVQFLNSASDIVACRWDFGNGDTLWDIGSPVYQYSGAGQYTVTQKCISATGCEDSYSKGITIREESPLGFSAASGARMLIANLGGNNYLLKGIPDVMEEALLLDVAGRTVASYNPQEAPPSGLRLSLGTLPAGIYFLRLTGPSQQNTFRLQVTN